MRFILGIEAEGSGRLGKLSESELVYYSDHDLISASQAAFHHVSYRRSLLYRPYHPPWLPT